VNVIETGLYTKLNVSAITTKLGGSYIYDPVAPPGQARPYVIFTHTGGGYENINPSNLQGHLYLVKGVANSKKMAGEIHDLILTALHNQTVTVSGYTNFWTAAEEEVRMVEVLDDGKTVFHCGAYYRIRIDG
jgi:hypothetical protein